MLLGTGRDMHYDMHFPRQELRVLRTARIFSADMSDPIS
jgi:hypothetical protein